MCQLNLYMVKNTVPCKRVVEILGEGAGESDYFVEGFSDYGKYSIGGCNCGSIVSKATLPYDYYFKHQTFGTFFEYCDAVTDFEAARHSMISLNLKNRKFRKGMYEYAKKREEILDIMLTLTKHIAQYEEEQIKDIADMNSESYAVLQSKITKLYEDARNTAEYQCAEQRLEDLRRDNPAFEQALFYNIADNKRRLKSFNFNKEIAEGYEILNNLKALCGIAGSAVLLPFWQENFLTAVQIKDALQISAADLLIDHIALLEYNTALTVKA